MSNKKAFDSSNHLSKIPTGHYTDSELEASMGTSKPMLCIYHGVRFRLREQCPECTARENMEGHHP